MPSNNPSGSDNPTLVERITDYLGNGGLFNPELMEHDKVRDLLMDIRDALNGTGQQFPRATPPTPAGAEEKPQLNAMLREVASRYQAATGIGLPFSQRDDAIMLEALSTNFRLQEQKLRRLQSQDLTVRQFVKEIQNGN